MYWMPIISKKVCYWELKFVFFLPCVARERKNLYGSKCMNSNYMENLLNHGLCHTQISAAKILAKKKPEMSFEYHLNEMN